MSDAPKFQRHRSNSNIYIHPGIMNQRVTIKKKIYTKDEDGFETYSTKEICTTWAKFQPIKNDVKVDYTASSYQENTKFIIYYHPLVDDTCVIEWNNKDYQIKSVENVDFANKYLVLTTLLKGGRDG